MAGKKKDTPKKKRAPARKRATAKTKKTNTPAPPPAVLPISTADLLRADMDTRETACTAAIEEAASKFNCIIVPVIKIEGGQVAGHVEIRARPPVV